LLGRPLNPVLARELKERMRTRRATVVIIVWLFILGATMDVVYQAKAGETANVFGGPLATQSAAVGRTVFETLIFLMLLLVVLLVPGLTADAITGERERQTLVPLQVTLLRPRSIVAGKLLASIAFVALLVVVSLPLLGVSFVLGGVTVSQLVAGAVSVVGTALLVACISILCSSLAGRTQAAVVMALGLVLLLSVGGPAVYAAQRVFDNDGRHPPATALLVSPFFAAADAVGSSRSSSSPLSGMRTLVSASERGTGNSLRVESRAVFGGGVVVSNAIGNDGSSTDDEATGWEGIPFWLRSTGVLAVLTLLAFIGATRRLRTPNNRTAT
jgi:ABC-type transport system involved in multi-copper enzyme maturation permease subunit